jgi:putative chitinase
MTNYITVDVLKKISPRANMQIISDLEQWLDKSFAEYEVNTYLEVCHFLAQAAHESDGFKTLQEYASGSEYNGRRDLGNTQQGDGPRFKGRGMFQITGRANYADMSTKLGVDLISHPELAATGEISVQTALEFWNDRSLSDYADKDDIRTITHKINGGYNGLDSRMAYLKIIKGIIPKDLSYPVPTDSAAATTTPVAAPTIAAPAIVPNNVVVVTKGTNSSYVKDLQNLLIKHGATITADGSFGNLTEAAILDFQKKNNLDATGVFDMNTINILVR